MWSEKRKHDILNIGLKQLKVRSNFDMNFPYLFDVCLFSVKLHYYVIFTFHVITATVFAKFVINKILLNHSLNPKRSRNLLIKNFNIL